MQDIHAVASVPPVPMETDADTTRAVQRVFALVRNGEGQANAKDAPLSLDDVVRFYNVSTTDRGIQLCMFLCFSEASIASLTSSLVHVLSSNGSACVSTLQVG